MTILKPRINSQHGSFVAMLLLLLLVGGALYIWQYSQLADNKHILNDLRDSIVRAEIVNAEVKDELYQIIDPAVLENSVSSFELVLERNPEYLNINQWVSDSSY